MKDRKTVTAANRAAWEAAAPHHATGRDRHRAALLPISYMQQATKAERP